MFRSFADRVPLQHWPNGRTLIEYLSIVITLSSLLQLHKGGECPSALPSHLCVRFSVTVRYTRKYDLLGEKLRPV